MPFLLITYECSNCSLIYQRRDVCYVGNNEYVCWLCIKNILDDKI